MRVRRVATVLLTLVLLATGCGGGAQDPDAAEPVDDTTPATQPPVTRQTRPTVSPTTVASATGLPATPTTVPAYEGLPLGAPVAAGEPIGLAAQLVLADQVLHDPAASAGQLDAAAHLQQVAYRQLGRHPEWDADVLARVPPALAPIATLHADARRQFMGMSSRPVETMPAWEIVAPEPAGNLLAYYQEAEARFGVPWPYLAAINLVETGMGRIRGLSVDGAQGPMQFMPATWATYGEGDINAPRDAILAAGRYLAANNFAADADNALFRYNRHPNYVAGVHDYARVIELDPGAFIDLYRWQVYYTTVAGDIWLPVGYRLAERMPVGDWLASLPG